jgi:hypothetical protein
MKPIYRLYYRRSQIMLFQFHCNDYLTKEAIALGNYWFAVPMDIMSLVASRKIN